MKTAIPYTSTLAASLMKWLEEYASQRKTTKRSVIEEALRRLQEDAKRQELAESFKRAAQDPEMKAMAEEGLIDYGRQLKALDL